MNLIHISDLPKTMQKKIIELSLLDSSRWVIVDNSLSEFKLLSKRKAEGFIALGDYKRVTKRKSECIN